MGGDYLRHNTRHIETYLDNLERIHRSAAGSEVPAGKETKGMRQYVAPISEGGFDYIDDPGNREAATLLGTVLEDMRREQFPYYYACGLVGGWFTPQPRSSGELDPEDFASKMYDEIGAARERMNRKRQRLGLEPQERPEPPLRKSQPRSEEEAKRWTQGRVSYIQKERARREAAVPSYEEKDHGILRRWKAGQTQDDRDALSTFEAACRWAAKRLPEETVLDVYAPGGRCADTPKQGAAMDREEKQREQHAVAHRIRYELLRQIEAQYPDATREAAKAMWSDRYSMSVSTIRDSIRFCERNEWPDGTVVVHRYRYGVVDRAQLC